MQLANVEPGGQRADIYFTNVQTADIHLGSGSDVVFVGSVSPGVNMTVCTNEGNDTATVGVSEGVMADAHSRG